jgi:outer membrane protein assembly factor BamD (BamD/ComL family)
MQAPPTKPAQTVTAPAKRAAQAKWSDWWAIPARRNLVLAVVGAVVVAGAGAWFWKSAAARKEAFASRAVQQARAAAEQGNLPLAASELQKITQTYAGTRSSVEAMLVLNQVRMVNGQTELAVVGLQEFIAKNPPMEFRVPAYGLLGVALENTKKPLEAAAAYEQASTGATIDYLKADYLLQAGRAYRDGGKPDLAIKAYEKVVDSYGKTPALNEAQVRLAELTKGAK